MPISSEKTPARDCPRPVPMATPEIAIQSPSVSDSSQTFGVSRPRRICLAGVDMSVEHAQLHSRTPSFAPMVIPAGPTLMDMPRAPRCTSEESQSIVLLMVALIRCTGPQVLPL